MSTCELEKKNYSTFVVLTGPLSLLNYRCCDHANSFANDLHDMNNWKIATTKSTEEKIDKDSEITVFYGESLTDVLHCDKCESDI
jgi:hypothetical protein